MRIARLPRRGLAGRRLPGGQGRTERFTLGHQTDPSKRHQPDNVQNMDRNRIRHSRFPGHAVHGQHQRHRTLENAQRTRRGRERHADKSADQRKDPPIQRHPGEEPRQHDPIFRRPERHAEADETQRREGAAEIPHLAQTLDEVRRRVNERPEDWYPLGDSIHHREDPRAEQAGGEQTGEEDYGHSDRIQQNLPAPRRTRKQRKDRRHENEGICEVEHALERHCREGGARRHRRRFRPVPPADEVGSRHISQPEGQQTV
jgi:hypothetical protein